MTIVEHEQHPAVYAREVSLALNRPRSCSEWERGLGDFLSGMAHALRLAGCSLIGHIKGALETSDESQIFFSLTTFQGPPHFKGQLVGASSNGRLTVNVIVYGVATSVLEDIVHEGLTRQFGT